MVNAVYKKLPNDKQIIIGNEMFYLGSDKLDLYLAFFFPDIYVVKRVVGRNFNENVDCSGTKRKNICQTYQIIRPIVYIIYTLI
jgi:hypothetical protein